MDLMKRLCVLALLCAALGFGQDLSKVHFVYLLPMSRGLDQYLANWLTKDHVFQVVTDPKQADTVFTDRIGSGFEEKLAELQANPEPVSRPSEDEAPASKDDATSNRVSPPSQSSSFGRGKGTVFLVDLKSHHVLWSTYQPSKDSSSDQLNRTASDIVSRLKRDLKSK